MTANALNVDASSTPPSADLFAPPVLPLDRVLPAVREQGFAVLGADSVATWLAPHAEGLASLRPLWHDLPPDHFLKDGGRYRRRRHGSFVVTSESVTAVPHRAHWQPLSYNALHGGMERWFEPMGSEWTEQPVWQVLLTRLAQWATTLKGVNTWYVEAHPFRIDTTGGIGRPTPEGAHRDGVDFVAVFLVDRFGIKGGESRVFDAHGPNGQRFTLTEPWSLLLLDDERVIHETTPIQPIQIGQASWRDTLVITLRRGGFQDPV